MLNGAFESLKSRPQPLAVNSFTSVKRSGTYEGFIVSTGPRDQELKTARVYLPGFNQIMNCVDLSAVHSSNKGIGVQYGLFAGDRVSVSFLDGNASSPAITGSFPHTSVLTATVRDLEAPTKSKTPISNVPVLAEWGFQAEYIQVLGMVLP